MTSQGGAYTADLGVFRSPDHVGSQNRHGWGGANVGDLPTRGGNSAYGVTPSLSGTSGPAGGGNGLAERAPGLSSPPAEVSRPLTQILNLTSFEIGDERWPRSRELQRAGDEARPNEGEDVLERPAPSSWTGEDAARLVAALNEVQSKARDRAALLTSCLNKLDRWQNQVANRKRKKEMQQTGASGGSLSSGNGGSAAPLGGDASRGGPAPGPAKKLRTSLVDVGGARPAKGAWGSPPAGWDSPRGVTNSTHTESEEGADPEWEGSRSKKKRTRKSDANGDVSLHEERGAEFGGSKGKEKVGKVWLGKNSQGGGGVRNKEKNGGGNVSPSKKQEVGKKASGDSPLKYTFLNSGSERWPRGEADREEKRTPGKEKDRGVLKGMRGPRTGVGGPNPAHLIRLKSFTSEGRNLEGGHTPRGVVKKPPPSGPVGGERKKSPLRGEKKRPASRSPSPQRNPSKVARLARTNSAALKLLRDEYIYTGEKQFSWGKEKKGASAPAPSGQGDWRKSPKGGVLKVEKEGLVIEAPDGMHISVLKKSHKKGGSAQYRKDMAAIANRFMLEQKSGFEVGGVQEDGTGAKPKKNGGSGSGIKRGGRTSRLGRQGKAPGEDSLEPNGDATPSSVDQEGLSKGLDGGLDSWGKPVRSKRTTRQGPDRAAKKMIVGGLQEDSEPESDDEVENEIGVALETLPQMLAERAGSDFWREVEPYFAFLKDEDLRFLRENFRELKEGGVVLSVPRCGKHFRKMWANEDQAWRFILDDHPKMTAVVEKEEPNEAEVWLNRAKKVSLSQRLLAALIDEEEPPKEQEVKLALRSTTDGPDPESPTAEPHASTIEAPGGGNVAPSEEPSSITEEPSAGPPDEGAGNSPIEEETDLQVLRAGASGAEAQGAESAAVDSRGLDGRIHGSFERGGMEAPMNGRLQGVNGRTQEEPTCGGVKVGFDDEDLDIVNEGALVLGGGGKEKGGERSAWEQKFDAMTLDERIQWELQSIGLVDEKEGEPEERADDPVCFELRSLQRQLKEQLDADNAQLEALEQRAIAERANEEREREKWAVFHFLEKLYERRKGARAGLGPGSSKGGKGTAHKKMAAKEAFLTTVCRALRKMAVFESGGSVISQGLNRKWEEKARVQASECDEGAPAPADVQAKRTSRGGAAPLAVKDDRKAKQIVEFAEANFAEPVLPVVHSKGQRTRLKKPVNKGKRKTVFGGILGTTGFGGEKELELERMREREADILAEAQAAAAAEAAAAQAEAEQQAAALNLGPTNMEDMTLDFSALPLPDFAGLGDEAFGGGFDGLEFGLGTDFNELAELDKFGLDDLGDMGF